MQKSIMAPAVAETPLVQRADIEDAAVVENTTRNIKRNSVNFLEANTNKVSLEELTNTCVVPTWGNQELTISHQDFVRTVADAARTFYQGEEFGTPDIRVSHIVRGRVPSALGKKASELLESEKTQFYQRLAFAFTIPTIYETVNGQLLELCVGGVRNYSDLNLYRTTKGVEKFSVFIGWRVNICSNQVLTGQGVKLQIEAMGVDDVYKAAFDMFYCFNPAKDIHLMQSLSQTNLTEAQFAQIVGRMRLYQALPPNQAKQIPRMLITDSQVNNVCRGYYANAAFKGKDGELSMWEFHNLLTESNKSSYIDSYLQRGLNATEVSQGICNALHGDSTYAWFLG